MDKGISWLLSFLQLEDVMCFALSQLVQLRLGALPVPVVVVTWEPSSLLLGLLGFGQQPSSLCFLGWLGSCTALFFARFVLGGFSVGFFFCFVFSSPIWNKIR